MEAQTQSGEPVTIDGALDRLTRALDAVHGSSSAEWDLCNVGMQPPFLMELFARLPAHLRTIGVCPSR